VAGCCECGDEPSGCGATELLKLFWGETVSLCNWALDRPFEIFLTLPQKKCFVRLWMSLNDRRNMQGEVDKLRH
jgi:hypothetical protein